MASPGSADLAAKALLAADSPCSATGYTECSNAGLPSNFCCTQAATCIPLADNTTVLCCPITDTGGCNTIEAITCDIQLQNATANPLMSVHTTALNISLPTCGDSCCPFGYTCNAAGNCAMDQDQRKAPSGSPATSDNGSLPSSTTLVVITETSTSLASSPTAQPGSSDSDASQGHSSLGPSSIAGLVVGLTLGLVLVVVGLHAFRRWRRGPRMKEGPGSLSLRSETALPDPGPHELHDASRPAELNSNEIYEIDDGSESEIRMVTVQERRRTIQGGELG